jgi:hypothetical protein
MLSQFVAPSIPSTGGTTYRPHQLAYPRLAHHNTNNTHHSRTYEEKISHTEIAKITKTFVKAGNE